MTRPKTYLVALDPEQESHPSFERAAWFAARTGAKLRLFLSEYVQAIDLEPGLREKLLAGDVARLQQLADRLARRGLVAAIDVRWERPAGDAILHELTGSASSLVFRDTHYHSILKRALFSSVEWDLIRRCPAPLWLVKDQPLRSSPRVLAAVDPSREHDKPAMLDTEILSTAKWLSQATAGELDVLHVVNPMPAVAALSAAGAPEAAGIAVAEEQLRNDENEEQRLADVERLAGSVGIDRARIRVERGTPAYCLVEAAEKLSADIVVMGAVSRSRLQNVFIGNTAERVLDRIPCDLLVVKEPTDALNIPRLREA